MALFSSYLLRWESAAVMGHLVALSFSPRGVSFCSLVGTAENLGFCLTLTQTQSLASLLRLFWASVSVVGRLIMKISHYILSSLLVTATTGTSCLSSPSAKANLHRSGFNISIKYAVQIISAYLHPGQPM
jgi:hypothetical protein